MTNKSACKFRIVKHFIYSESVFKAMRDLGLREYYTSSSDYIVLKFNGVWQTYEQVQKQLPSLPYLDLENTQRPYSYFKNSGEVL